MLRDDENRSLLLFLGFVQIHDGIGNFPSYRTGYHEWSALEQRSQEQTTAVGSVECTSQRINDIDPQMILGSILKGTTVKEKPCSICAFEGLASSDIAIKFHRKGVQFF